MQFRNCGAKLHKISDICKYLKTFLIFYCKIILQQSSYILIIALNRFFYQKNAGMFAYMQFLLYLCTQMYDKMAELPAMA